MLDLNKLETQALARGNFLVRERLVRTRDGRVIREADAIDGGNLLFKVGDEVPLERARSLGLLAEPASELAPSPSEAPVVAPPEPDRGTRRFGAKR